MILPDVNLLIYAYNADAPHHDVARAWWERLMREQQEIRVPWAVTLGFVRLMTHPRVLLRPMPAALAVRHVQSWHERSNVRPVEPGPRHLAVFAELVAEAGVSASLTTDAHLAALAIEHGLELHSHDRDFARFSALRRFDPLV